MTKTKVYSPWPEGDGPEDWPRTFVSLLDYMMLETECQKLRAAVSKCTGELGCEAYKFARGAVEPLAGILENKLSQDQMQALFTGNGAPGREHHDPTCIKFFGVFSPLPCPCKRPAERITVAPQD